MGIAYLCAALGPVFVLAGKTFQGIVQVCALSRLLRPPVRVFLAHPVRFLCCCLASLALSVMSAASYAEGTVNPVLSPSAPPLVKYYGYNSNFDTPEAACADMVAHQWDYISTTNLVYDHIGPYPGTVNMFKCYVLNPINNGVSWFLNVAVVRSCDRKSWVWFTEIKCTNNVCPANSKGNLDINPTSCTCNDGYVPDPTRTSCVPVNLKIKLEGGTTIEPRKSLPFIATVTNQYNQPPTNPVTVNVSLKVDSTSGGHDHGGGTRPRGGIANVETCSSDATCWSETSPANNGVVVFNFNAPEASGTHTVTATCDECVNSPQTAEVNVKVDGVEPIPAFPYYALEEADSSHPGQTKVVGETDLHGNNHNLMPAAAQVLMRIAVNYHFDPRFRVLDWQTNTKVPPPLLHVNDASLEWGGKFDIKGTWTGAHEEHRRGTSVDLRANEKVGAIPPELFDKFEERLMEIIPDDATVEKYLRECTPNERPTESNPKPVQHNRRPRNYCVSQVDGSFDNNRHFHVRLMGE